MNLSRIRSASALLLTGLLLVAGSGLSPIRAQTTYATHSQVKQETRKGVRQAKKAPAEYKDTHLNPDVHTFKKGRHGRRRLTPRDGYEFDESGYPIILNKPKKKGLFRRKKAS